MARARVLVVDDDPMIRQLVTGVLRKDYLVAVANDGLDGFNRALEHAPDVVLLDVQMPNWDGLKTLRAFRQHPQLRKVPVIMLTVDSKKSTVLTAIQAGASDYIIKADMSPEKLQAKLIRVLAMGAAPVASPHTTLKPQPVAVPAAIAPAPVKMIPTSTFDEKAVQAILDTWE
jgi:CheY-like chemotaxis protein